MGEHACSAKQMVAAMSPLPQYPDSCPSELVPSDTGEDPPSPQGFMVFLCCNLLAAYLPAVFLPLLLQGLEPVVLLFTPVLGFVIGASTLGAACVPLGGFIVLILLLSAKLCQSSIARLLVPGGLFVSSLLQGLLWSLSIMGVD